MSHTRVVLAARGLSWIKHGIAGEKTRKPLSTVLVVHASLYDHRGRHARSGVIRGLRAEQDRRFNAAVTRYLTVLQPFPASKLLAELAGLIYICHTSSSVTSTLKINDAGHNVTYTEKKV